MSSASTAANTMWLFIGTYVARSLTPSFSANSGIWPAPSAESFRTVSFADGQRSGGCCPTIRYCTELLLVNGKHDPTPPGTDCVVARPTICSTPGVGAVNAARRASLNQPPTPCARGARVGQCSGMTPEDVRLVVAGGDEFSVVCRSLWPLPNGGPPACRGLRMR